MKRVTRFVIMVVVLMAAYLLLIEVPVQVKFAPRTPLLTTPADLGMAYRDFELTPQDAAISLKGWWMPAAQPSATLLFLHGASSNRDSRFFEGLEFYQAMVARGVSVAAIDLRNHGASDADGGGIQFGQTEQYDARALVDWAYERALQPPIVLMGISMGGATAIRAIAEGVQVDGLILLDSLLHTRDAMQRAIWTQSGLPPALLAPSAWSAVRFFGFPDGPVQPLTLAKTLQVPMLLLQDPQDPVTRAQYANALAAENPNVTLWLAPPVPADHARLVSKGRWGTHVAAFALYPDDTVAQIMHFIARLPRQ